MTKDFIEKAPDHFFIVASKQNLQEKDNNYITVIPVTSKDYQRGSNAGVEINQDDIESMGTTKRELKIAKLTLALANKICRIPVDALKNGEEKGRLKKSKYEDILYEIKICLNPK